MSRCATGPVSYDSLGGLGGVHAGHSQIPVGMVVRGGNRKSITILCYICHKGAFSLRQTDSGILGSGYRPGELNRCRLKERPCIAVWASGEESGQ